APSPPPIPHFPRFRALALFGRRPPQRVDSLVMPASENLHMTGLMQRNKKRVFAVGTRVTSRPFSGQGGASVSAERRTRQAPQADRSLGNILRAKKAPAPSCKCANENGSWTRTYNPNWEEGPASRR